MKETYVQAVLELLNANHDIDTVLANLRSTLKKRGHSSLYSSILQAVYRVLEAKRPSTFVVVASQKDYAAQKDAITAELASLGAVTDDITVQTDVTLIGGRVVEHNFTRTDKSYKQALLRLYRSVTGA